MLLAYMYRIDNPIRRLEGRDLGSGHLGFCTDLSVRVTDVLTHHTEDQSLHIGYYSKALLRVLNTPRPS